MTRFPTISLGVAAALLLATTLTGSRARAQSADDKAAAEALYDDGKKLFLAKKYAEACPKLEASQKLDPGIGNLLFLADCWEGLGRTASAWGAFREAAGLAKAAGQAEREKVARTRAAALEPRLHKLAISVSATDTPGLVVKRNDADLKREVWGTALPIDPGSHTISASATGKKPWSMKVQIAAGPGSDTVTVPALEDAPVAPVAPPTPPPPPATTSTAPEAPPPPAPFVFTSQRIAGLTVGGAGVLALGLAATFGGLAFSANTTAGNACPRTKCTDQDGVDASTRAATFADLSTGLFIGGGIATVTGLIVFLAAPSPKPEVPGKERAWVSPVFGAGFTGLSAGRTW